jgi:hypothetical protein
MIVPDLPNPYILEAVEIARPQRRGARNFLNCVDGSLSEERVSCIWKKCLKSQSAW